MNGVNGTGGPPGLWQEARNADGRVYYYNVQTKATQWAKPQELMTPVERALSNQPWKEYTAEGGRKYWYNTDTKTSTWEIPDVYKQALGQSQPTALPPKPETPTTQFVAGGGGFGGLQDFQERAPPERQIGWGQPDSNGPSRGPTFQKASGPDYSTYEEAEAAFFKLLRRSGVGSDWTWEHTVRATVKDPQYQAVKDPRDRKTAFEKYINDLKIQERERAKERLEKLRADFGKMLRSHQEIKHYTRWKTARPIIEREAIFRSTDDENERRQLFEEYIIELKKAHVEQQAVRRKSAMDELVEILKNLDLEPYTRWSEAHNKIENNPRFASEQKFRSLTKSDVLTAFENHIKALERTFNDQRQKEKQNKARKERKNRDAFIDLLKELRTDGKIKAGTKWSAIHPLVADDPRFQAILGQPGSGPLDLFRDVVEEEERSLRLVRNEVYDVLEDRRYEVTPKTAFPEFQKVMSSDRRTGSIPTETLELLFSRLVEKVTRRAEEDKHASERHARRAVDALRSRIKRLEPPIRPDSTWEQIRTQISHLDEFTALESEDQRKTAFDKVLRRIKEKEEDTARERERADRDPISSRSGGGRDGRRARASRSSFTPEREPARGEPDAYEADRKKAMADRERQYRKGGSGATGLSPSSRDRDRERDREPRSAGGDRFVPRREEGRLRDERDRERDRDRDRRRRSSFAEEDERERDRLHRSRAEGRGGREELDYDGVAGDRYGGSGRRRRQDSEGAESMGSARKRARRDDDRRRDRDGGRDRERDRERDTTREKENEKDKDKDKEKETEKEKEQEKEEIAMHSGSEEGEMVED